MTESSLLSLSGMLDLPDQSHSHFYSSKTHQIIRQTFCPQSDSDISSGRQIVQIIGIQGDKGTIFFFNFSKLLKWENLLPDLPGTWHSILLLLWDLSYFSYYSGFPISDDNEASWVGARWIRIDHTKLMIWHFVNLSLKILRIDILTSRKPSHCHRLNEHHHLSYLSLKYKSVELGDQLISTISSMPVGGLLGAASTGLMADCFGRWLID